MWSALRLAAFGLLIFLLDWGGVMLTRDGSRVGALWLPNALLAATLLRRDKSHPAKWLLAAFAGYLFANFSLGDLTANAVMLALANCVEALFGTWLLLRWQRHTPDIAHFGDLVRFGVVCCGVAPLLSSVAVALWLAGPSSLAYVSTWTARTVANGLGMLIVGPIVLAAIDAWRARATFDRDKIPEAVLILAVSAAIAALVFGQSRFPLLFLITPIMIVAAFRLGVTGTAASFGMIALIAVVATGRGAGPIFLLPVSPSERAHIVQLFLATNFGIWLPIASALAGRDRIRDELAASHKFAATLLESMREVVFRADANGRWVFLNSAWPELTGYSVEESIGWPTVKLLHPDDLAAARLYYPKIASGEISETILHQRFFHASGECRHIEVVLRRVSDENGGFAGTTGSIRDTSASVAAQRALEESEARFRRLAEAAPVGIYRAAPDGSVTYLNKTWADKIGLTVEETLGDGWKRALAGCQSCDESVSALSERGEIQMREAIFRAADGSDLWVRIVNSPEFSEAGELLGFIGAVIDITEQRRASTELGESKRLFEALAALSPAGIFRTDIKGQVTYVNPAWMTLAGLDHDDAMGGGWSATVHPDDLPRLSREVADVIAGNSDLCTEFRFLHRNGDVRWAQAITAPALSESGERIGHIGVNIDITDRKLAEFALAAQEEQLRLLAENATDAVFRIGLDGVCHYASPSVGDLLGVEPRHLIGRSMLQGFHPDDAEAVDTAHRSLASGEVERLVVAYRAASRIERGQWIWLEANCGLVRHAETRAPQEIICSVRDISERKRLELELDAARQNAEVAAMAKSTFLANMSHEIRTPMGGVLGFTELLLADNPTPAQRHKLQMIADSGAAMMRLLNDILDLSKIEAGQVALAEEAVDIRQLVDGCVQLLMPLAGRKDIELTARYDSKLPAFVVGDGLRLKQILLNLVGNGVKFTDAGSVSVSAFVDPGEEGAELVIEVEDTGIGIAEDRQMAVFGQFVQADGSTVRKHGGTGLGLTISTELALMMAGSLNLVSKPEEGTVVTLRVPLRPTTAAAIENRRPANALISADQREVQPDARILIAEDNQIQQLLIKSMLARLGFEPDIAGDGAEAIRMIEEAAAAGTPYQLVLMDMQMPSVDGLEATRLIRASGITDIDLPIVALTANAYPADIQNCMDAGMQGHLTKPVTLSALDKLLHDWLGAEPERVAHSVAQRPAGVFLR
jgi:PAS domain S-box-containing protein